MKNIYEARLLLVDDNPDLIALLRDQLTQAGYHDLVTASSCAQARAAFDRQRPALMILDINLPDGDGFALLRELVARFCDSPAGERCTLTLEQTPAAEQARVSVDEALLGRAVENLLGNSVRHNAALVQLAVRADCVGGKLQWCFTDDGVGYPPAVLAALRQPEENDNAPHILGLHVVEQIVAAHGGSTHFGPNRPRGACAVLTLPLLPQNVEKGN